MTVMQSVSTFTANLVACAALATIAEFLVPAGKLKNTVGISVGLVFTSMVADQILGIIGRMGV